MPKNVLPLTFTVTHSGIVAPALETIFSQAGKHGFEHRLPDWPLFAVNIGNSGTDLAAILGSVVQRG